MSGERYDEAYFLRGKETGVSLYENYRFPDWVETEPGMAVNVKTGQRIKYDPSRDLWELAPSSSTLDLPSNHV